MLLRIAHKRFRQLWPDAPASENPSYGYGQQLPGSYAGRDSTSLMLQRICELRRYVIHLGLARFWSGLYAREQVMEVFRTTLVMNAMR